MARSTARIGLALIAPLAVAVLRLFPELEVAGSPAARWLPALLEAAGATTLVLAATLAFFRGMRSGAIAELLTATGLGTVGAGLAAAAVRASDPSSGVPLPDPGLPLAILGGSAALLAGRSLVIGPLAGGSRVAAGAGAFIAIEAMLAVSLLVPLPPAAHGWLLGAGAVLAASAAFSPRSAGIAALAGGALALAMARPGSVETLAGLMAMVLAGLAAAWPSAVAESDTVTVDDAALGGRPDDEMTDVVPRPEPMLVPAAPERSEDTDALRLARELRGTIDELLQARRTIELQRVEIANAAARDRLTAVASRRAILERLRIEAAEARRYLHPLAVVLIDVDAFARLNADHSLAVGDAVLRELALRLRLRIREADGLGRIGGDAFLGILPHTDERGAAVFADAVRRRMTGRPISTEAGDLRVTVSIGVAFVRPGMTTSDEEVLAAAEEALASARAAGGNRIAFDRLHGLVRLEDRGSAG